MNQRWWVKLDTYLCIGILLNLQSKIPKQRASPHAKSMCCEGKERRVFDKRCKVHSLRITIAKVQCSSLSSQAGSLTHALALKGSIYIFLLGERIPLWSTETRLVRECTEEKMRNLILMWILNLPVEEWTTDATVRIGKVPCGVMGHPPTHIYPDPATSHKTPLPSQYLKIYWLNTVFVNSTNTSTNIYPDPATSQSPRTYFFNQIISAQGRGVLFDRTWALYLWTHRSTHLVVFPDDVCRKLGIN